MPWSMLTLPQLLPTFALVLMRVSGLVLTAPLLSDRSVPRRLRVALTLTMSAVLFPMVASTAPQNLTMQAALVGVFWELVIGLTIGLSLTVVLAGIVLAGTMIGQQAGIGLAQVFNPALESQTSVMGQLYFVVAMLAFLGVGVHRALIQALLDTFTIIPLLSFHGGDSIVVLLVELLAGAFSVGIRLAGPALVALMLTSLTLGFLSRTIPQLNILSVGFAIRTMVALAAAGVSLMAADELLLDAADQALMLVRVTFGLEAVR